MTPELATLFPASDKARLIDAAKLRTSCRAYRAAPDMSDIAALTYHIGRYALPGARLTLQTVPEDFFTGALLGMNRITGCRTAAAVIVSDRDPHARIHAGILGEAFVLEATARGLGTCWCSGTYRKQALRVGLAADESVLCVIALGVPVVSLTAPRSRHRKPPEHFCRGNWRAWPEQLLNAAALVQQAPSAMNMQPWTLYVGEGGAFVLDTSDRALLDAGIALCHAELALTTPHTWRFGIDKHSPVAWAMAK